MHLGNTKKILFLIFCYFVLYYISSSYMYARHDPNLLASGYDSGRYLNLKSFFDGAVTGQKTAWHLFFTYTLFIRILEKLNLINYYVEAQYLIYYLSSIFFYKSLINFNFSKLTSFLSTFFVVSNPFFVFWIHTLNHAGLTIGLFMISFFFLSKYDQGKIFKILFFIFIFLTLKLDGKVFFTAFMMLFYQFFLIEKKKLKFNFLILLVFFISYFLYLSKFAVTLEPFAGIYFQTDLIKNGFNFIIIDDGVIKTFNKCLIHEYNSLRNHFCALLHNPSYSISVYATRLFALLTWINPYLSIKYNFFAVGMMVFIYFGLSIDLLKTKFTKFKFFLISSYLLTSIMLLPYLIRGDQKPVFYGLVFIIPLTFSGYEILFKYFKKKLKI
jgi:hypothetical protein